MIAEALPTTYTPGAAMTALVPIPHQADGDSHLIKLWLHGRPQNTLSNYSEHSAEFLAFLAGKPLQSVTLGDLQDFADTLSHLAPARCDRVSAKSCKSPRVTDWRGLPARKARNSAECSL